MSAGNSSNVAIVGSRDLYSVAWAAPESQALRLGAVLAADWGAFLVRYLASGDRTVRP